MSGVWPSTGPRGICYRSAQKEDLLSEAKQYLCENNISVAIATTTIPRRGLDVRKYTTGAVVCYHRKMGPSRSRVPLNLHAIEMSHFVFDVFVGHVEGLSAEIMPILTGP